MKINKQEVLLLLLSVFYYEVQSQCTIDIRTELNRTSNTIREPVFLKYSGSQYELMIPDDGILSFNDGQEALIACISDTRTNLLTFKSQPSATITCSTGNKFIINGQLYSATEFNECSLSITGNTLNRNQQCGSDGSLISIGYQLTENRGFVKLIDTCYSKIRGSAIYTSHIVQGSTINDAMKTSLRPSTFKTAEVPSNIEPATSFTKASQLIRLTELFGSKTQAEEYMNKTYLARGHLSPDGDMIFVSWQWSTYYYINVVPQWQAVNNGNWKVIETAIRTKAGLLQNDLLVITGGYEVLELNSKKITLEPEGLEVPKWSWKVVKDTVNGNGIAFVTYNNPFATNVNNLCNDICNDNGWDWKERKNYSKGYTICCDVADIMGIISDIPPEASSSGILQK